MTNLDELYHRMRAADPAVDVDVDPDGPLGRRLRARAMTAGTGVPPLPPPAPRKRVVVSAAVGLMLVGGGSAVTAGVFGPDPDEVAATLEDARESGVATLLEDAEARGLSEVKTEDWRPTLRSERVVCAHEDGSLGATSVAHPEDFPMEERIDEDDLIAACASGTDQTRHLDSPQQWTVCEGAIPAEDVHATVDRMTSGQGPLEGRLTHDRPAFPVVLGWVTDCDEATIETSPQRTVLGPWSSDSMQELNRARQVELGLTAAAIDRCLHPDEARAMASQARDELAGDWPVVAADSPASEGADGGCSRVWLDGRGRGLLEIGPQR